MRMHYTPHIDNDRFNGVLNFARNVDFGKGEEGGSAMFRSYPHDDSLGVLYSKIFSPHIKKHMTLDRFKIIIKELWTIYQGGGSVAPILGVAIGDNGIPNKHYDMSYDGPNSRYRDVIVVNNAPGKTLVRTKPAERLACQRDFYTEITKTFAALLDSPLKQDVHNRNILFHPVAGYNCVDFNETIGKGEKGEKFMDSQVSKFLMSFVPQERLKMTEEEKAAERKAVITEQKQLVYKLNTCKIKESHLEHGLKKIKYLGSPTVDQLFGM